MKYIAKAIPMLKRLGAYNIKTGRKWRLGSYCLVGKVGRKGRTGLVKQVQKAGRRPSEIKKYYVKPPRSPFSSMPLLYGFIARAFRVLQ